jgi:class 3 adenylate cyclase/tetratricopeptide (TPR) repeat protein
MDEREQLEQAIRHLEAQREVLGDEVVQTALKPLREKLAKLQENIDSEQRKQVTVLFADLVGFTSLAEGIDPEDMHIVLDEYFTRWAGLIERYGGRIEKFIGDAVMAVYGLEQARENDPERAVQTALGMIYALKGLNSNLDKRFHVQLNMRVGIHTGLVVISTKGERSESSIGQDFIVVGDTVNLASRLQSVAPINGILISQETYHSVSDLVDVETIDPILLKGKSLPVQAYIVLQLRAHSYLTRQWGVEGIPTRMVGRESELNLLKETITVVEEEADRQVVTLVGEAGIGKSRLAYEFESWANRRPERGQIFHAKAYLEGQWLPYSLLRSLFAIHFNILDDDPTLLVREKIVNGFKDIITKGDQVEEKAHHVGQLIGYDFQENNTLERQTSDPQQRQEQALAYLIELFKAEATHVPLLLLLEDLHWADDSSLDMLTRLVLALDKLPVMVIGTARPEFFERRPHWFEGRAFHTRINLHPLTRRESLNLVEEVLQNLDYLPKDLRDLIVSNAEGNPFYLEELIKMLVDGGVILKTEPRWQVQLEKLATVHVPSTLIGILQARLESLPSKERILLQQASVIGRIFWDRVLIYINQIEDSLLDEVSIQNHLLELRWKEMLYQREPSTFADSSEYIFKHAVLREVTYESVLKRYRRAYHAKVAEWLIEHSQQRQGEITGLVADHLEQAGKNELAFYYLKQAADEAAQRYANSEAIQFYQRALSLAVKDESEKSPGFDFQAYAQLYESLGDVLDKSGRYPEAQQAYQNALSQPFQKTPIWESTLHRKIGFTLVPQYRHPEAFDAYERAEKALGEHAETNSIEVQQEWLGIQLAISQLLYWEQRWPEMAVVHEKIGALIETQGRLDQKITFLGLLAQANIQREQYRFSQNTLDMIRRRNDLVMEKQNPYEYAFGKFMLGFALLWHGNIKEGLEELLQALELAEKIGAKIVQVRTLNYISLAYRKLGNVEAVNQYTSRSMEAATQVGEHYYVGIAHANLAWIAWREKNDDLAYQEALAAFQTWDSQSVSSARAVFQMFAALPALAITVSRRQFSEAAKYATRLLPPYDPPLPEESQTDLRDAIRAVEDGNEQKALSLFSRVLAWAKDSGDL